MVPGAFLFRHTKSLAAGRGHMLAFGPLSVMLQPAGTCNQVGLRLNVSPVSGAAGPGVLRSANGSAVERKCGPHAVLRLNCVSGAERLAYSFHTPVEKVGYAENFFWVADVCVSE